MKWIIFTGTWKLTNQEVEKDVREAVSKVFESGGGKIGIITGGATGVDYFCMEEVLKLDKISYLRVILPTKLDYYLQNYNTEYDEDKIDFEAHKKLSDILKKIQEKSPTSILEMPFKNLTQKEYDERNSEEIKYGDEVYAFQVNNSKGTEDTINKAIKAGLTIRLHKKYDIVG